MIWAVSVQPRLTARAALREGSAFPSSKRVVRACVKPSKAADALFERARIHGLDSIDLKAKELGLHVSPEQRGSILAAVKKQAIAKHGLLSDDEFRVIVDQCTAAAKA